MRIEGFLFMQKLSEFYLNVRLFIMEIYMVYNLNLVDVEIRSVKVQLNLI